jgi:hypothetical protein
MIKNNKSPAGLSTLLLVLLAILSGIFNECGTLNLAGNSTDFGNARVIGVMVDSLGVPATGVRVRLIPDDFDATSPTAGSVFSSDTSDAAGRYSLSPDRAGTYVVEGKQLSTGRRTLVTGIHISRADEKIIRTDTLRPTGSIAVTIPDSLLSPGSRVGIKGTTYGGIVDSAAIASRVLILDSLPEGAIPPLLFRPPQQSSSSLLYANVRVTAGDTQVVDSRYFAGATKKHIASSGDALQKYVDSLNPGDTLLLRGGTYAFYSLTISLRANASRSIVIGAYPGETPVLRNNSSNDNCINIIGAEYVVLDNISIDTTYPGTDAIKFTGDVVSSFITIRNCDIHNLGGKAVNALGPHHDIVIANCHIHDIHKSGAGAITVNPLDLNGNRTTPHNWTIENNWIHDVGQAADAGSEAIIMLPGCYSMTVRDNTICRALTGGILSQGYGGENSDESRSTLVEGNVLWECGEALGLYGDVVARNNIVFSSMYAVFSYAYENTAPARIRIYNNTFYGCDKFQLGDWDSVNACIFANNAVYAVTNAWYLTGGSFYGNVGDNVATGFLKSSASADLANPDAMNFYPTTQSPLIGHASGADVARYDFNGTLRNDGHPDAGAYEYTVAGNPGWKIVEGFKGR